MQGEARTGWVSTLLVLVLLVAGWEAAVLWLKTPPILFPAPSAIWAEFLLAPPYFMRNALYTLWTTLAGFGLAVALRLIYTLLVVLNSLPKVALAPLFVIWMGTGVEPKIAIALMLAIFAIVADAAHGLRSVDPDALALARVHRASGWQVLVKLRLPNAMPALFVGMKVAVSFALVGAIVGEFVGGSAGLGYVILMAQGQFDTPRVFVALVLLGIMGTVLFFLVAALERAIIPWHVSQRASHGGS